MPLEKLWLLQPTREHHGRDCNSPHTQAPVVKQSSIHANLKWQDSRTTITKWTGLHNVSFYLDTSSVLQKCEYFNIIMCMPWICAPLQFFCIFVVVLQMKSTSSNNSRHTNCTHKGLHARKWPEPKELQTRVCQYTGIPLNRLHWNHTGWCYHPVVSQWQSSVHVHNWNTLEDHWSHRYTVMTLEPHWLVLASSGVPGQSSVNLHNWNTLDDHWNATKSKCPYTIFWLPWMSNLSPSYWHQHQSYP